MSLNLSRIKEYVSEENFEVAELYLSQDGQHFVFVYKIEGKYFAQIKDKVYGGFDSIENVSFLRNGKVFVYKYSNFSKKLGLIKDENQDLININGKIIGAFNKIKAFHFNENLTYYIWYEYLGKSYVVVNNNRNGEFKAVSKVFISPEGSSYAIQYKESRHYIKIDDEVFGGYEEIKDFTIDYENKFTGFLYKKETGEYFANINSKVLGPYENCTDLHYYKELETYYFFYKQEGVNFVQINNFVFGGYDSYSIPLLNKEMVLISSTKEKETVYHIIVKGLGAFNNVSEYSLSSDNENYIFSYSKLGLYHVVTSDYEFGPYSKVFNLSISKNGQNYCFIFQKQYDNYYVNINGDIYGPYVFVSEVKVGNSASNFGFIFTKNAKYFVNISNELHGMYEGASNLVISDNSTGYSFKFTKRHKTGPLFAKLQTYLSMNGEIVEKDIEITEYLTNSQAIEAIIYRKKEGYFLNLSDTDFGPFSLITDFRFLPDDTLFAFKYKENQNDIEHLQINGKRFYSQNKNNLVYSPIFSIDRKKYAFIHYLQNDYYVQITDQTFGPFEYAFFPSFSPDSKIFIFKYMKDQGVFLNINGMDLGPFGKAEYTFSDNKLYISYLQENMIFIDEITW